jgi:small subunit ribosomal protein S6
VREYEFTFVVQPEISDDGIQAISQRFEGILAGHASEKLFYEDWGRRRLAYEIRNFQKGHYQVLHFLSDGKVVPELERSARLDDSILRFLTVLANDDVTDVDGRRAEGVVFEEERKKRAAEKAVRDAEEAARAAEEAAQLSDDSRSDDDDDDDRDDDDDDRGRGRERDRDRDEDDDEE